MVPHMQSERVASAAAACVLAGPRMPRMPALLTAVGVPAVLMMSRMVRARRQ